MNAMEATLQKQLTTERAKIDNPEKRLLARVALAEREFEQGEVVPASQVVSELYAIAERA